MSHWYENHTKTILCPSCGSKIRGYMGYFRKKDGYAMNAYSLTFTCPNPDCNYGWSFIYYPKLIEKIMFWLGKWKCIKKAS